MRAFLVLDPLISPCVISLGSSLRYRFSEPPGDACWNICSHQFLWKALFGETKPACTTWEPTSNEISGSGEKASETCRKRGIWQCKTIQIKSLGLIPNFIESLTWLLKHVFWKKSLNTWRQEQQRAPQALAASAGCIWQSPGGIFENIYVLAPPAERVI